MNIFSKAANKVSAVASQAAATASQWYQLDAAQRQLAQLRAQALQTRAQIGEEMYRLWQSGTLPPSNLDPLFREVERIMAEVETQRVRVAEQRAQFTTATLPDSPVTILDQNSQLQVLDTPMPAPVAEVPCPSCGRLGPTGKPFCGYCGTRLG